MKIIRTILSIALAAALLVCSMPVSAIHSSFFNSHSDWHFDLTREPNRAMTVEELIALSTAYSYWTTGAASGTLPKDKNGHLPSDWAAPYIRNEYAKRTFDPRLIAYDAPATLADWMQFLASCKGLYSYNARNIYEFSGADDLTPEQVLLMSAAVDYGLIAYRQGMDVSRTLLRKDLEGSYKIPEGEYKTPAEPIRRANNCKWSMIYFEDCYNNTEKTHTQLESIKKYEGSFNLISLNVLSLQSNGSDGNFVRVDPYRLPDSIGFNPYHMELIDYCKQKDIKIVAGAYLNRNDAFLKALKADPANVEKAAKELAGYVSKYALDGLHLVIEMYDDVYRSTYSALLQKLSPMLHAQGKLLIVTSGGFIRAAEAEKSLYDYAVINACSDLVVLTLYDDHSAVNYQSFGGTQGELSSYESARRRLLYAIANFGSQKVLVSVGTYGVDYNLTKHTAENISREEISALKQKYGLQTQTHGMPVDDAYLEYTAADGSHIVYFDSDAGLQRRLELAPTYGTGGVCFFHSGSTAPAAFAQAGEYLRALPFLDVKPGWYYDSVKWAVENAITSGMTATTFRPEQGCTRGQVVTFLWRAAGCPKPAGTASFADISPTAYYASAVSWAVENGITNGTGPNTFKPDATCTRGQIVTFLWRAANRPAAAKKAAFDDVGASAYYADAVDWAVEAGITNGTAPGIFKPNATCTRAQVVTFLYRS